MAQRVVAVEVSTRVARAVVLETTLRRTGVVAVVSIPIPAGAGRREVLALVREAVPGPIDSLVIAADPRLVSTRSLRFPFGDLRKLESAVGFELEGQVPYDLEDTALTWHVTSRRAQSLEALAALTSKKQLAELIADAEAVGLEARAVVPAAASLAELAPHGDAAAVAIAALGESTTQIAVVHNGELRLARTIRAGGADVDRALARAFGVEVEAAKVAKESEVRLLLAAEIEGAEPAVRRVSVAAAQGLAPLVTGLATTFKALPAADAPARLFLTGGLSRLPGLAAYLAQRLAVSVELVDLQAAVAAAGEGPASAVLERLLDRLDKRRTERPVASGPAVGPEMAPALAMAISVARHGRTTPLNFRRGEHAYQGDIQLYRGQVTRIAVGVAAVILLAIAGSIVRYSMITAEERRLDAAFCATTKRIVGREICDGTAALATMRQPPGAGEGVVIPPYSAASLLEMMSKSIGSEIDVSFEDLEIRVDGRAAEPDRITGKGEAATFESTEQIAQGLKTDACVQDVEIGKQRKTREGNRVEFNITVKVVCAAGALPGQGRGGESAPAAGAWEDSGIPAGEGGER